MFEPDFDSDENVMFFQAFFSNGVSRDVQNQEKVCAAVLAQTERLLLREYVPGCSEGWRLHEDRT